MTVTLSTYHLTKEQLEEQINHGKEVFLNYLEDAGYLTNEHAESLHLKTAIILRKPSFFCSLWKYFGHKDPDYDNYIVVEQKTFTKENGSKGKPDQTNTNPPKVEKKSEKVVKVKPPKEEN